MARKKSPPKRKKTKRAIQATAKPREPRPRPVTGSLLCLLGVLLLVALVDYAPAQDRFGGLDGSTQPAHNLAGTFGATAGYYLLGVLGVAAYLVPALAVWAGLLLFRKKRFGRTRTVCLLLLPLSAALLAAQVGQTDAFRVTAENWVAQMENSGGFGGLLGRLGYEQALLPVLGPFGAALIAFALFAGSLVVILADDLGQAARGLGTRLRTAFAQWKENRAQARAVRAEARREAKKEKALARKEASEARAREKAEQKTASQKASREEEAAAQKAPRKKAPALSLNKEKAAVAAPVEEPVHPAGGPSALPAAGAPPVEVPQETVRIVRPEKTEKAPVAAPRREGGYQFPPRDLLAEPVAETAEASEEEHRRIMGELVEILGHFNVAVEPGEIHTGPVITRYEVVPKAGVRVEKIANLDRNIALGLKAHSVRILAPVPGKGTVGVEIPNPSPAIVGLRELLDSRTWYEKAEQKKADIPIVIGKEVSGKPLVADLGKMPHLLIAGATGAGKTVCINTILGSLLYRFKPEELRLVLVDPKIVEMKVYNDLPHMMIPVVTEPKKVPAALKYLLSEMERRYQIFAEKKVRNIAGFNRQLVKDKAEREKLGALEKEMDTAASPEERAAAADFEVPRDPTLEMPTEPLPYIVCVIDELADLMMAAPAEVEHGVSRLAQLARAAGIHLIVATQRPSVNVITGVIKANLPSRIAFKVAAKVDSRVILDTNGADQLIGRGDMLFLPPGSHDLVRAQCAFISDDEVVGLVDFMKKNGEPDFDEKFIERVERSVEEDDGEGGTDGTGMDAEEELIQKAWEVVKQTRRASTSMLQRRLRIGYNKAARTMEELEERGYVGPDNGSQPRDILRED